MHHLTHAANRVEAAFSDTFDIKKCGCETPNGMGERVNDGRCEHITIDYDSESAKEGWKEFMARLTALENEFDFETKQDATTKL